MGFSLSKLFGKTPSKSSPKGSGNKLTTANRIGNVLQHLIDDRTLLTIKIPDSDESYTSAVLDVNRKEHTFEVDEITPVEGHRLFLQKKRLHMSGQSRGAAFSCSVALKEHKLDKGIAVYTFDFPKTMEYIQRRASYRAKLKGTQRIAVTTLHKESNTSISGYVIDLSMHGISIMFNTDRAIKRGDILTLCRMQLPDGPRISFDLNVRYAQKLPNERLRIGAAFHEIDSRYQTMIQKLVRKIERDSLRGH